MKLTIERKLRALDIIAKQQLFDAATDKDKGWSIAMAEFNSAARTLRDQDSCCRFFCVKQADTMRTQAKQWIQKAVKDIRENVHGNVTLADFARWDEDDEGDYDGKTTYDYYVLYWNLHKALKKRRNSAKRRKQVSSLIHSAISMFGY